MRVCFYSVLFLLLIIILFIYSCFQQVLFATFDPPDTRDGVGHYCVVALNVKERRFEFLDSLNKPGSPDAIRVFRRMVKNIKRAWKEGSSSSDEPLNPPTLDGFVLKHVIVPMQPNGCVLYNPFVSCRSSFCFHFIFVKLMFFILFIAGMIVDSICFNSCRHGMVFELLSLGWSTLATSERPCSIVGSHRESVALI